MRFAPGSMDHFLGVSDCPAGTGTSASSQLFRHQKELVPGTLDIQSENSAGKESVATCLYASAFNSEVLYVSLYAQLLMNFCSCRLATGVLPRPVQAQRYFPDEVLNFVDIQLDLN